jgi:hypothetical protein
MTIVYIKYLNFGFWSLDFGVFFAFFAAWRDKIEYIFISTHLP